MEFGIGTKNNNVNMFPIKTDATANCQTQKVVESFLPPNLRSTNTNIDLLKKLYLFSKWSIMPSLQKLSTVDCLCVLRFP